MNNTYCTKCSEKHQLYYLLKADNTYAMFVLCPNYNPGVVTTLFIPIIKGLPIKTYVSGSAEYRALKKEETNNGIFSPDEMIIIKRWKDAKLVLSQMTMNQVIIIKRYCLTNIKW